MATRQEKERRAEAAARQAADDLRDINSGREYEERVVYKEELDRSSQQQQQWLPEESFAYKEEWGRETSPQQQQQRPGVIGTVLRAVQGTYEHAKEAVVGKSHEREGVYGGGGKTWGTTDEGDNAKEFAERAKDTTMEKAGEYKDYASEKANQSADKAKQMKDTTKEKAAEYTDYAAQKAKETKNSAAQRTKETKDTVTGKASEYTDYAAQKA
ncbi:hypothetical protein Goari_025965, partial [Gossypium aridum]|nr:hypothetical protein [Gossypium aridum]